MNQLTVEMAYAAMAILGALAGFGLAAWLWRGKLRAARADLEHVRRQAADADAERLRLDRLLIRSESMVQNLEERLDEARDMLAGRNTEFAQVSERNAELGKALAELRAVHAEKLAGFREMQAGLEQSREQLRTEFRDLANQILEEKGRTFAQHSQTSLEALLRPFREQIDGFQQRVNQIHDEALRGNVSLGAEIRRVLDIGLKMSSEAQNLAAALKGDKKTVGNWGEVQLERSLQLAGLVRGDHYDAQPRFKDSHGNSRQPDFIIRLPDHKHLIIDSKVSLVDYERAIAAGDPAAGLPANAAAPAGSPAAPHDTREEALRAHVKAVRNHIDDLSRKDYSNLIGVRSPSFVLMFMPIEAAYIEALKHGRDLFDYGYQRNVILVSHTTLLPILKTVANLWMVARSNEQAHELSARAGEIYNQVIVVAERLKKLGDTLDTVSRQYNSTVTAVAGQQGLYGKVARFSELSSKATKSMPALEPLRSDFEGQRLDMVLPAPADETGPGHIG